MAKLYAVTKGDFDSYHIIALTTSKYKAEKIAAICSGAIVEKYEEPQNVNDTPLYTVYFYPDGGVNAYKDDNEEKFKIHTLLKVEKATYRAKTYRVRVEAESKEKALEIAGDIMANYKTMN